MNLKEYNYCKRYHPHALSRLLGIRINKFEDFGYTLWEIHDGGICDWMGEIPDPDAKYHYLDISRWITLQYLI